MKLNNSNAYEHFQITLSKDKYPIAFKARVENLVKLGVSREYAEKEVDTTPIELEIYYEPDNGLMAVESDVVTCCDIYSPYTGEKYEPYDE